MKDVLGWFGTSGNAAFAAFVVSLVAIMVSAWSLILGYRLKKRHIAIEEGRDRDRVSESRKARLVAHIEQEPTSRGGTRELLVIENKGKAEARDIVVTLDAQPVLEHQAVLRDQAEIRQVGPESRFQYILALSLDCYPPFVVEVNWTDDSGQQDYRNTLTL